MAYEHDHLDWKDLYGRNHWEGLLEPLHPQLRSHIIHCGDYNQATYDAFNNDPNSPFCGSCRYGRSNFFEKVHMVKRGQEPKYEIFGYLYATAEANSLQNFCHISMSRESWSKESNWIGYVAVSTDAHSEQIGRRDVIIAWRGTTRSLEWVDVSNPLKKSIAPLLRPENRPANLTRDVPEPEEDGSRGIHFFSKLMGKKDGDGEDDDDEHPKVMHGWYTIYTADDQRSRFTTVSARTQLLTMIKTLVTKYRMERGEEMSITLVGHSLGAALATLSAFDMVENGLTQVDGMEPIPVAAFIFGSPGVGNRDFNERFEKLPNLRVLHIRNELDTIPHYPGRVLGYHKTGVELVVDSRKSPYLKPTRQVGDWHNLQAALHLVAGWNGKDGEFKLAVKRSVALVNKSCDYLKEECLVPGAWWVEKNKGLVQEEDGDWVMAPPHEEDQPTPEEFDWWVSEE